MDEVLEIDPRPVIFILKGLYFMALSAGSSPSWLFICPLSMYLMFALVTCRMMDNRSLARRSDYAEYMKNTSQLFLWPPKSN